MSAASIPPGDMAAATTATALNGSEGQAKVSPPGAEQAAQVQNLEKTASAAGATESTTSPTSQASGNAEHLTPESSVDVDTSRPKDFEGEVKTNNEIPAPELIKKIEEYVVLDRHGKSHTFKSLYNGPNVARRVLVIFVRHFFCGNCQEYLRYLSESITPEMLLRLPINTFITVIGCGDPALIDMYAEATNCPFPIYSDPTRSLYDALGMMKTLAMGERPAYMRKSMFQGVFSSVFQGLKQIKNGLALKAGDQRQVGGEFLFEPLHLATPVTTPMEDTGRSIGDTISGVKPGGEDAGYIEEKRVTWCHRMRTTRDHAEIPELMEILGLDGQGQPIKDQKRWEKSVETRKGTGESLAKQMSQLKE